MSAWLAGCELEQIHFLCSEPRAFSPRRFSVQEDVRTIRDRYTKANNASVRRRFGKHTARLLTTGWQDSSPKKKGAKRRHKGGGAVEPDRQTDVEQAQETYEELWGQRGVAGKVHKSGTPWRFWTGPRAYGRFAIGKGGEGIRTLE